MHDHPCNNYTHACSTLKIIFINKCLNFTSRFSHWMAKYHVIAQWNFRMEFQNGSAF